MMMMMLTVSAKNPKALDNHEFPQIHSEIVRDYPQFEVKKTVEQRNNMDVSRSYCQS